MRELMLDAVPSGIAKARQKASTRDAGSQRDVRTAEVLRLKL
jgi:hypothetical protein